jgi:hypothetical protein
VADATAASLGLVLPEQSDQEPNEQQHQADHHIDADGDGDDDDDAQSGVEAVEQGDENGNRSSTTGHMGTIESQPQDDLLVADGWPESTQIPSSFPVPPPTQQQEPPPPPSASEDGAANDGDASGNGDGVTGGDLATQRVPFSPVELETQLPPQQQQQQQQQPPLPQTPDTPDRMDTEPTNPSTTTTPTTAKEKASSTTTTTTTTTTEDNSVEARLARLERSVHKKDDLIDSLLTSMERLAARSIDQEKQLATYKQEITLLKANSASTDAKMVTLLQEVSTLRSAFVMMPQALMQHQQLQQQQQQQQQQHVPPPAATTTVARAAAAAAANAKRGAGATTSSRTLQTAPVGRSSVIDLSMDTPSHSGQAPGASAAAATAPMSIMKPTVRISLLHESNYENMREVLIDCYFV